MKAQDTSTVVAENRTTVVGPRGPGRRSGADPGGAQAGAGELPAAARTVVAIGGGLLSSAIVQLVVGRLPIPEPSAVAAELALLGAIVLTALALWTSWATGGSRLRAFGRTAAGAAALSALPTLVLALPLHGTRWYYGATQGDFGYHMQFLTRLADSPALADLNFRALPPFYPVGWFWVGGRAAALLGVPAWELAKPLSLLTMGVAAALAQALWTGCVGRRRAVWCALATVVSGLVCPATLWEPFGWLCAALVVPLAVRAVQVFQEAPEESGAVPWRPCLALGAALGAVVLCYTLYAAFLVLILGAAALPTLFRPGPRRLRTVKGLAVVAAVAALLGSVQWVAYFRAAVPLGLPPNPAQRYLPSFFATLNDRPLTYGAVGLAALLGTAWAVLRAPTHATARGLLTVIAVMYAWCVLSLAAVAGHTTLLPHRTEQLLTTAWCCAAVLGAEEGIRLLRRGLPSVRPRQFAVLAVVLALLSMAQVVQSRPDSWAGLIRQARQTPYPAGGGPAAADKHSDLRWMPRLVAAIDQLSGHRRPDQLVVLTAAPDLVITHPYWNFTTWNPNYQNPLADLGERNAEVTAWSRAATAGDLRRELAASRFAPPDVLVLRRRPDGLAVPLVVDGFPRPNTTRVVTFPYRLMRQFREATREVGPFTVVRVRN